METATRRVEAKDLRFYFFNRSIHPELFDAKRQRHLEAFGYSANISLVNTGGHVISVSGNGQTFTEAVLPSGHRLPKIGKREDFRLVNGSKEINIEEDILFKATTVAERPSKEKYSSVHRELSNFDALNSIKWFRPEGSDSGLCQFSLIRFESSAFSLDLQSFHFFPEQRMIIAIDSTFEVTWYS